LRTEALGLRRIAVVVVFALCCFGLMLYLWNAFGGAVPLKPKGYRAVVALPEADLLAEQADVRVSGVSVGRVVATSRTAGAGSRKDATLEIDPRYAPLRRDVRATIRRKSLAGEEYLELTPGGAGTAALPDGGRLDGARVAPSVEIDEVLRTFDAPTRRALEGWVAEQAVAFGVDGARGAELNDALGALPGFEESLTKLLSTLNRQQGAVRAAVSNTGVVFDALSERRTALRGMIVNGSRATDALARSADGIAGTFRALPTFEAESRRLLARAERFRLNADPVVTALRPGARAFSEAVRETPATAAALRGLVREVGPLTAASRRGLPAAARFFDVTRPLVAQFSPFLAQLEPVLAYVAPRADTLSTLVANLSAATNATTAGYGSRGAGVHYLRSGMALNPGSLAQYPVKQSWSRVNPYPDGSAAVYDGRALGVFDAGSCAQALAFPRLAEGGAGSAFSADMLQRIEHFVLNDDDAVAPACALQRMPRDAATQFPQISPLSRSSGGTTP
jgi:phospholipid/cholesterol/gamma-HCH transport system substrate-binding protein